MQFNSDPPEFSHQPLIVVVLVTPDGLLVGTGDVSHHCLGGISFPSALTCITSQSTIKVWRLSVSTWPRWLGSAGWALDFRHSRATELVLERWVLLLSLMPRKSPFVRFLPGVEEIKLLPGPEGGGDGSSFPSSCSSEACDAQACSRAPSTEKCPSLSSRLTSGEPISFFRNFSLILPSSIRGSWVDRPGGRLWAP